MNHFTITRALEAPVGQVGEIVGNPGTSPGPGVDVEVERPGAPDGTGLIRAVKIGPATVHEEITRIGPGHIVHYRMTRGTPVRDYVSSVALQDSPTGGTRVSWDVQFRPVLPVVLLISLVWLDDVPEADRWPQLRWLCRRFASGTLRTGRSA